MTAAAILLALLVAAGPETDPDPPGLAGARAVDVWRDAAAGTMGAGAPARAAVAHRLDPDGRRISRVRPAATSAARRNVRKRELLRVDGTHRGVERPDPSVPALAAELERAASARERAARSCARAIPTSLRLLAAGAAATRLHLPPPIDLL